MLSRQILGEYRNSEKLMNRIIILFAENFWKKCNFFKNLFSNFIKAKYFH